MKQLKNVIITGGNEGIGYFMTKELLEKGNRVAIIDIHTSNLKELVSSYPKQCIACECDVSDSAKVNACVLEIQKQFQTIDYAIHNACHAIFKSIVDSTDEDYISTYKVNFLGAVNLIRAVKPIMISQNCGDIFLTSSGVGVMGFANLSPYATSKGAIETLAKSLNLELNSKTIKAHLIHPPLTNTTSASSLPVPKEFMASPEKVGRGIAKHLHKKRFIIAHSFMQRVQNKMMYMMPVSLGKFMNMMTQKATK